MTSTDELERLLAEATPLPWEYASDKLAAGNIKAMCNARLIVAAVNALPELLARVRRYESALHEVIGLDHHNMGPESRATKIARAALKETTNDA